MGKSSQQANTTTTTTYTTDSSVHIGLSGSDVNALLGTFSNFALGESKIIASAYSVHNAEVSPYANAGSLPVPMSGSPDSLPPAPSTATSDHILQATNVSGVSGLFSNPLILIIGSVALFLLLR